jgi:hypothetical protein
MNIGDLMIYAPLLFQRSNHGIPLAGPKNGAAVRPAVGTDFLSSRECPRPIDF